MTPLLLAAQGGKHRAIGKLMDRGADIYAVDEVRVLKYSNAFYWPAYPAILADISSGLI